ncbi:uncharacterized protein haus8 isoform X3 [Mustelus asterias]
MAACSRRSVLASKKSTNLPTYKHLRSETESKSPYNTSVQSSQHKTMQVASEQLFIKPTTPSLKRRDSFSSRKSFNDDSCGSGSGILLKSSKSVPNLSDSRNMCTTPKSPLPATPCPRPRPTHSPRQKLSQCDTLQRVTPKPHAAFQNTSCKKLYKDESKGSDIGSSMDECSGKMKGARVVPSRFREAATMKKKAVGKGNEKSSEPGLKRLNVKKRCSDLHSTGLEESAFLPSLNWDLSAMKPEFSAIEVPEYTNSVLEPVLSPTLPEEDAIEVHNFDALLYSYLALMLEHLRPVVASNQQFKIQYRSFGQALDTTRHSLQTKNIYRSEDLRKNLEELKIHLKTTYQLLDGLGLRSDRSNSKAGIELGEAAAKTDTEIKSFFTKIEELASCISRETTLIHQELDEEALGMKVSAKGIFI